MNVEWIMLADSAEVINNKLYLMGGGWNTLMVNTGFPTMRACAIVASFLVPPGTEPNLVTNIELQIADEQGTKVLVGINGQVEITRSPFVPPDQGERLQTAVNLSLVVEQPGRYVARARVGDKERTMWFNVIEGPSLPQGATPPLNGGQPSP